MISIFPLSRHDMLGFTLNGSIDTEGMRRLLTAAEAKVLTHGTLRLLGNIKNIGGLDDYRAFWETVKTKRALLGKIEKYAILTDQAWLSTLASGAEWLSRDMEVKVFRLSEGERAHAWLKESTQNAPPTEGPAGRRAPNVASVEEIDLGHERLLGLRLRGELTATDYDRINALIGQQVARHGRARLLLELDHLREVTPGAVWEDFKAGLRFYKDLERVAIVGDQSWLKAGTKLSDLLTPGIDMSSFTRAERGRAVNWLL